MIMSTIDTLTPIVVTIALSMIWKNTRWIGIVCLAVTSYFYPVTFLVIGTVAGLAFWRWKSRR